MTSPSGRFVTVYNGEIYNHLELRERLPGPWRGHSDTETLLAAIEAWGVEEALRQCVGMFALALWDRQETRADPRPRPARREAALLRLAGRRRAFRLPVRLGAEGARPPSRLPPRDRPAGARPLHPLQLRAGAALHLFRNRQAAARDLPDASGGREGSGDHGLIGRRPKSPPRAPPIRSTSGRRRRSTRSSDCSRRPSPSR